MASPACEQATRDAQKYGRALLKFLSPNDCGVTGTHQYGFLLPKPAWEFFTPYPPEKGQTTKHTMKIEWPWPDELVTESVVTWYGEKTRSEYRLTRFGKDFPHRNADLVGALFVLIRKTLGEFNAYVLDLEDDIEEIQSRLGVQIVGWAEYRADVGQVEETEDECVDRRFREFAEGVEAMPSGKTFSATAREILAECIKALVGAPLDDQFLRWVEAEDRLFRLVERKVCQPEVTQLFKTIDDFIKTALSILNARKSRAGRSLENHMEQVLKDSLIPFDIRKEVEGTRPDFLIPGKAQYEDSTFPVSRLFMVASKRTCKERWTEVLREAPRIKKKHILTIQEGASLSQLEEMRREGVALIVPKPLHKMYPKGSPVTMLDLRSFVESVRSALAAS